MRLDDQGRLFILDIYVVWGCLCIHFDFDAAVESTAKKNKVGASFVRTNMDIGLRIFVVSVLLVTVTAEVYIVTMEGDPIISYKGGENGFEATAVESDEKIDTSRYLDSFWNCNSTYTSG